MEAPLVLNAPKLTVSFRLQPPHKVRWGFHPSPFKNLFVGLNERDEVCVISFARGRNAAALLKQWQKTWPKAEFNRDQKATAKIVAQMFKKPGGKLRLYVTGTPFQQSVWKQMLKIPAGYVTSYADIARVIKNPKAVRAVGTACGANPVPILVPCHRVIASNGLGGFGGGLPLKKAMLRTEGW